MNDSTPSTPSEYPLTQEFYATPASQDSEDTIPDLIDSQQPATQDSEDTELVPTQPSSGEVSEQRSPVTSYTQIHRSFLESRPSNEEITSSSHSPADAAAPPSTAGTAAAPPTTIEDAVALARQGPRYQENKRLFMACYTDRELVHQGRFTPQANKILDIAQTRPGGPFCEGYTEYSEVKDYPMTAIQYQQAIMAMTTRLSFVMAELAIYSDWVMFYLMKSVAALSPDDVDATLDKKFEECPALSVFLDYATLFYGGNTLPTKMFLHPVLISESLLLCFLTFSKLDEALDFLGVRVENLARSL